MLNNVNTNVEHIIAKIDNDFNPDNSDWIPRVGAWVIEAMSMLKVLRKVNKKIRLDIHDGIAYLPCSVEANNLKVFDSRGCEITKAIRGKCNTCNPSTGEQTKLIREVTPSTVDYVHNTEANYAPDEMRVDPVFSKDYSSRYNVKEINYDQSNSNYVLVDGNKIEINFKSKCIYAEFPSVETVQCSTYDCEMPVIPNNGTLIEAIGYFCLYKMLCRGYKHPVFNLTASQYGTNPFYEWTRLKSEAKRSVTIDAQGNINDDGGLWRSSFFIATFDPR